MSILPAIVIVAAAHRDTVNAIWEFVLLRGPNNLARKCCAIDPEATHETPATHFMFQDMGATDTDIAAWQALASGAMPAGVDWGVGGIPIEADAVAACTGGNLLVFSAAGLVTTQDALDWRDGTFAGVGLQYVPDEPL